MAKKKYYAVKKGKVPGVYETWDDCKDQTQRDAGQQQRFFANFRGRQCANRTAEDKKQDD